MEAFKNRELCLKCLKSISTCYCHLILPLETNALFVILIHPKEARNALGTGRMTHLSLTGSYLIEGVDFTCDETVNALIEDPKNYPVVLYPGKNSIDINDLDGEKTGPVPKNKRLVVFVVDGTWSSAKKMMKLSRNLHGLPRLCFKPGKLSSYAFRVEPHPICLSTVEAVYQFIGIMASKGILKMNSEKAHENLFKVFLHMVKQQVDFKNDGTLKSYRKRNLGFKKTIKPSKKWTARPIFYNG